MKKELVKAIQNKQYEMLVEVKKICNRHNIKYFLCCGTLLGCIRHQGPIPWDDDLDVGMFRNDYNLFLRYAKRELSDAFFVQTWKTDAGYALPHCKIRYINSHYVESVSKDSKCVDGISIDILPFDAIPGNKIPQVLLGLYLCHIVNIVKTKRNWEVNDSKHRGIIKKQFYRVISKKGTESFYIHRYEKLIAKSNRKYSRYVTEPAGKDYFRFIEKKSAYCELEKKRFVDEYFYVPKQWNRILRDAYGNYMKMPDFDERHGQPGVLKVIV